MNQPPFKRHQEGLRLYYDMLSSKGTHYYEVEMLGAEAVSCECRAGGYGALCKHRREAEQAEIEYQRVQREKVTTLRSTPEDRRQHAPFHNAFEFSLMKR